VGVIESCTLAILSKQLGIGVRLGILVFCGEAWGLAWYSDILVFVA